MKMTLLLALVALTSACAHNVTAASARSDKMVFVTTKSFLGLWSIQTIQECAMAGEGMKCKRVPSDFD